MLVGFKMRINASVLSIIGLLLMIASLIPFFGLSQFDSQPFPLFFAIIFIILLKNNYKFIWPNKNLIYYLFCVVTGCFFACLADNQFSILTVRACAGYLSIFLYYIAFENYIRNFGFPIKIFQAFILLWILVGIYQLVDPTFGSSFIAQRTTASRGVTSLAPEPTHFGIFLFFSSWLILLSKNYRIDIVSLIIIIIAILAIIFLAQSTMTLLYLMFSLSLFFIYLFIIKKYTILFLFLSVLATILIPVGIDFNDSNRILMLATSLLSGNFNVLLTDSSSFSRFSDILFPLVALFKNNLLPGGFSSFGKQFYTFFTLVFVPQFTQGKKIMSWTLSMWYELGFFGILAWFFLLRMQLKNVSYRSFFENLFLFLIFLSAIPALFPLPIMAMLLINNNKEMKSNEKNSI